MTTQLPLRQSIQTPSGRSSALHRPVAQSDLDAGTTAATAPPLAVDDPAHQDAPSLPVIERLRRRLRSIEREAAAARHRDQATDRLLRAGIHHLR